MYRVIKHIIKHKYNKLCAPNVLLSTTEITNVIQFVLYLLHKKYINEFDTFCFIYALINNFNYIFSVDVSSDILNNTGKIINGVMHYYTCMKNFESIIHNFSDNILVYNILHTHQHFSNIYLKLLIIMYKFYQMGGTIKKKLLPISLTNFYKLITKLYNTITHLNSSMFIEHVNNNHVCYDKMSINVEHMHNNLLHIVNHVGVDMLRFIGVNVITNIEFDKMKYNKKLIYYNKCIRCIEKFLESVIISYKFKNNLKNKIGMLEYIYNNITRT